MKALRSAHVCVIDDEPSEYEHLVRVLNGLGLGCVHVAGDKVEELPKEPLRGLRLVFLDMQLGTGGPDARVITAHTAKVFASVVAKENAPIVVVAWTKHAHMVQSFRESLFAAHPDFRGGLYMLRLEKPADAKALDPASLAKAVEEQLAKLAPIDVLWGWDSLVQAAACAVTDELCRLGAIRAGLSGAETEEEENAKILKGLSEVLRILIEAEDGKTAVPDRAAATLLGVLAPLHLDKLENMAPDPLSGAATIVENVSKVASTPKEACAINTMLLVGGTRADGKGFLPGTVYEISDRDEFGKATRIGVELMEKVIAQDSLFQTGKEGELKTWRTATRPIVVEISPACDYSQGKRPLARLLGGFLVPAGMINQVKKAGQSGDGHHRRLPTVRLRELAGDEEWVPQFSSQLLFTWPEGISDWGGYMKPVGRLREAVLVDLRDWLAGQGGRVGYLWIDGH